MDEAEPPPVLPDLPPQAQPRPTMTDVAARAGVSQTTVSLVLNGATGTRIAEATRLRVIEAAAELGYRHVRRVTRRRETEPTTIAFVVDEVSTDPWMAIAMDGIREAAWEQGLTVTLAATRGDPEIEEAVLGGLDAASPVGVIWGAIYTRRVRLPAALSRFRAVTLNCIDDSGRLPAIVPDEIEGGRRAAAALTEAGHRRIGLITGQEGMDASADRVTGYEMALRAAGVSPDPDLVVQGNWAPPSGYAGARALMALKAPPTAILCSNDLMAMGAYEALHELGLAIPSQISVVGYDDRDTAQFLRPELTTVRLPQLEMGGIAVGVLMDVVAGRTVPEVTRVAGALIRRGSVARPA